ncbi:MAG: ferrous iron transport protein A [Proteobacteria bacterium]|nr:ferrous iron transport protein A [Pseudomonadota bacterium]
MILNKESLNKLGELEPGSRGEIAGFCVADELQDFLHRLYEVGFLVGEEVEILKDAPIGKDPISIRVKDAVYAMRREDANLILVSRTGSC